MLEFFTFLKIPQGTLTNFSVFVCMSAKKSSIITYNIRLTTQSQEDHNLLLSTLSVHQQIWDHISQYVFKTQNINKKLIHDDNYYECRKLFPDAPSQVVIRAKDSVYSAYKSAKSNKVKLTKPCKQHNLAIRLDKRLYKFLDNNRITLTTTEHRIICSYQPYDKFQELFSKYSVCDPLIFMKNNEFWISVSFEIPAPTYVENSCIGVDLGIRRFAVTSEGLALSDKDFLRQKRQLRYQKRVLQSLTKKKRSHSGRKKLRKLKRKERNKNKNLCHHLANRIFETESNTIVLEDLSSLKKKNLNNKNHKKSKSSKNRLSQVSFGMIRDILTYKAPLLGKRVVTVDPSFTSQRDHRGLKDGKRQGCRYYASDGNVFDADWNAAINIARKHTLKQEINKIDHPIPFSSPYDGGLNLIGRLLSTNQSSYSFSGQTQPSLAVG